MTDIKALRAKINNLHVLIVDDEEAILEGTVQFMKKFFKSVDTANNGQDALQKINDNKHYDVVFTDIKMPKKNGWELIQEIRAMKKNIFIAAMTGSPELGDEKLIALCDRYLRKPVNFDNMIQILEELSKRK
ncbi:MAG: response regulator [Gammaproteobacteria bacterium]|nr:response regulator [Gammaproteobacteria bacterium]